LRHQASTSARPWGTIVGSVIERSMALILAESVARSRADRPGNEVCPARRVGL
jgi:hypothetical protein